MDVAALPAWATVVVLAAMTAFSLYLRTRQLGAGFWIDEGLSVGIAHHHLWSIPHLLREDGSPPLYYMLLHLWIGWFGDGERSTHTLSLIFALACIPLAYWVGRSIFGPLAGLVCAGLVAVDPFMTYYAQETRMYSLVAMLSFVAAGAYVHGVLNGKRWYLPLLGVALVLILYTHNWGLFLALGYGAATLIFARDRWREAAIAAAVMIVLYLPWLPTLLYQSKHTAAPWAIKPSFHALLLAPGAVLSGDAPFMAIVLAGGLGFAAVVRRRGDPARRPVLALAAVVGITVLFAWVGSQISPAWTTRYFAVLVGPLLAISAAGLVRAGRLGLVALIAVCVIWSNTVQQDNKENARAIMHGVAAYVHPGDLVLSTHPEQVPVLRYYLGPGYRYATTLGPDSDSQVMDWEDALQKLRAATPAKDLAPVLAKVKPGQHLVVVSPVFRDYRAWDSRWTREVFLTSQAWTKDIARDPRFRQVAVVQTDEILRKINYFKPLQAVVYVRRG
jgi:4-amino-4-deoxy-L-arabinose transferase-like glycosyltransferase